jgi:hypothetical protein
MRQKKCFTLARQVWELVGPGRNAEETSSAKLGYGGGVPHLSGERFFKNLDGDHALVSLN